MLTPGADPVRKISIIPRGHALGVTFQSPDADRYAYAEPYLRGRIVGALGGMAAEQVVYGDVSTGAESDLDQVTRIARQMVGRWGMSERIGPIAVLPAEGQAQPFLSDGSGPSPATRELVDSEARRIVDECYERAVRLLRDNRDKLDRLAAGAAGARDAGRRGGVRGRRRAPDRPPGPARGRGRAGRPGPRHRA